MEAPSFCELIAELCLTYLQKVDKLTPTEEEFVGWVDSHALPVRPILYLSGPAKCWASGNASFKAWVLQERGFLFHDFMANRLCEQDYLRWLDSYTTPTLD
jgi:hypothetical protein